MELQETGPPKSRRLFGVQGYEGSFKTALICDDISDNRGVINSALIDLDYNVDIAAGKDDLFEKIKFNQYDIIVLNESFGGSSIENNGVLKFFQDMPMVTRRHILLVLVVKDLKTLDSMAAFCKSVNAVVNQQDLQNMPNILKRALDEYNRLYKVYKETLKRAGKR